LARQTEVGLLVLLLVVIGFFVLQVPAASESRMYLDLMREMSPYLIASIGITMLMIAGELDLSIGAMLALTGVVTVSVFNSTGNMWLGILMGLLTGPLIGMVNGYLVTKQGMSSLVTTLGSMFTIRGLVYVMTNKIPVTDQNDFEAFQFLYHGETVPIPFEFYLPLPFTIPYPVPITIPFPIPITLPIVISGEIPAIPIPTILAVILIVIFHFILSQTEFGRQIYAIGGNQTAAKVSGIKVGRIKFILFLISSTLAAVSGLLITAQTSTGYFDAGVTGFELFVIASVVLGGVSLSGGQGTLIGTVLGVFIQGMTAKGLRFMGVQTNQQLIVTGLVMMVAVFLHDIRKRVKTLRRRLGS
ncbi:MAG: ABC transporter permease, partial [Burkholderiales bacterium]|nr:ABC transporter permease [Anaerolineae bacterium]